MDKNSVSYTELTHRVVREAADPLPFKEIVQRVEAITPITTKKPEQTIRNAVSNSRVIVSIGDKRYAWKPRIITGSALRLTLTGENLQQKRLSYTDEVKDALFPAFFANATYDDRSPVSVTLADGTETQLSLEHGIGMTWGTLGTHALWTWIEQQRPVEGDQLILTVQDGMARRYRLVFEARAQRDEEAIADRNRAMLHESLAFIHGRRHRTPSWELTEHLLVRGHFQHPIPPDPLVEIAQPEIWGPLLSAMQFPEDWLAADALLLSGLLEEFMGIFTGDAWLSRLLQGQGVEDMGAPVLPAESELVFEQEEGGPIMISLPEDHPLARELPVPKKRGADEVGQVFVVRVKLRGYPEAWRDIAIAADQTLEELHLAIQDAYRWDDDHLYSFYLSGRAWDRSTEIGSPWSDAPRSASETTIGSLGLKPGKKFLYLFDYGDQHEFDVEVREVQAAGRAGTYPRVVDKKGRAPKQYANDW